MCYSTQNLISYNFLLYHETRRRPLNVIFFAHFWSFYVYSQCSFCLSTTAHGQLMRISRLQRHQAVYSCLCAVHTAAYSNAAAAIEVFCLEIEHDRSFFPRLFRSLFVPSIDIRRWSNFCQKCPPYQQLSSARGCVIVSLWTKSGRDRRQACTT